MKAYLVYPAQFEEMSIKHFQNIAYVERSPFEKEWGLITKDKDGVPVFAPFTITHLEEEGDSEFVSCSADHMPDVVRIPMKAGR